MKNAYVGRTFIQPSQTIRQLGIRLKLNPLMRGDPRQTVSRRRRLDRARQHPAGTHPDAAGRPAPPRSTHRVQPVRWPCFYGIDFCPPAELIANGMESEAAWSRVR